MVTNNFIATHCLLLQWMVTNERGDGMCLVYYHNMVQFFKRKKNLHRDGCIMGLYYTQGCNLFPSEKLGHIIHKKIW